MTYTTIHLVRHGEVRNPDHVLYERLPGYHLSDRGHRMAERTALYLAANHSTARAAAVFSSPLERAQETAGAIVGAINPQRAERGEEPLAVRSDDRLIEAGNEFRGTTVGRGEGALWRNGNWRLVTNLYRPSWGETYRHIARRMNDFVQSAVDAFPDGDVIVVSHESPIWTFRCLMETGRPEHNMFKRTVALASVTSFTFDNATHRLVGIAYADPASRVR